jgi:hypothetical protein
VLPNQSPHLPFINAGFITRKRKCRPVTSCVLGSLQMANMAAVQGKVFEYQLNTDCGVFCVYPPHWFMSSWKYISKYLGTEVNRVVTRILVLFNFQAFGTLKQVMCFWHRKLCIQYREMCFRDKGVMQNSQKWFWAYFPFLKKEKGFMAVSNLSISPPPPFQILSRDIGNPH